MTANGTYRSCPTHLVNDNFCQKATIKSPDAAEDRLLFASIAILGLRECPRETSSGFSDLQCPIVIPPDFLGRGASQINAAAMRSIAEVAQKT